MGPFISTILTRNPGFSQTLHFLWQRFWWSFVAQDAKAFIAACPVYSHGETLPQPPGHLNPLDSPQHPWSPIAVDFVIGHPPSDGNKTILTVVYCLSKTDHFNPLTKLPSAGETGHVFHLQGFPKDMVSDRGPQFTL